MKKAVCMFLTAALAVSCLAGCGGNAAGNTLTGNASAGTDSSAADDSAADGSVFKIGSIGPTTGDAAIYGNAVMVRQPQLRRSLHLVQVWVQRPVQEHHGVLRRMLLHQVRPAHPAVLAQRHL